MSKRGGKKGKKEALPQAAPFTNNAFSGLAALGGALPSQPAAKAAPVKPKDAVAKPEAPVAKPRAAAAKSKAEAKPKAAPAQPKAAPAKANARFPNKLVVRMEKKGRRGKTVTRVSGVPTKDLAALCKEMKKALGCGATIEDADLILLGDLVQRAVAWFEKSGATRISRGT